MKLYPFVLILFAASACSSTSDGGNNNTSDGGTVGDAGPAGDAGIDESKLGQPPAAGAVKPADGTSSTTFAITKLFLGDTDRDGTANRVNGWKAYGYNIDGRVTTEDSTNVCTPRNNAPLKNLIDGTDGLDNSYGRNILPISLGIDSAVSEKINNSIHMGKTTTLFELQKLGPDVAYNPIFARVYTGADMGMPPRFDGTDEWPVTAESLVDSNNITSAKMEFSQGYVVGNTWVSGKGDFSIVLSADGKGPPLLLHNAVITMELAADHKNAVNGTISGVISTDEVIAAFAKQAQQLDPSFCTTPNPVLDSINAQIAQASDIMSDGTQDSSKSCDGITIGLGFEATVVQLGGIATPVPPPPDPCAQP